MANHVMYYECEKCNKIYKTEEKAELCCSDRIDYEPKTIQSPIRSDDYVRLGFNHNCWSELEKHSTYYLETIDDYVVLNDESLTQIESEIKRIRDFVRFHNIVGDGLHPIDIND